MIDFGLNSILLSLNLFYSFYDTRTFNEWIFVISELEIFKISRLDFKIIAIYELPDFFESIEFKGDVAEVKCSGGGIVILNMKATA